MTTTLLNKIKKIEASVRAGLNPMLAYIPDEAKEATFTGKGESLEGAVEACWRFNEAIIKAMVDLVPAVKPQIAMYEQFGVPGLIAYEKTVHSTKELGFIVTADVKRSDISLTSVAYTERYLGSITIGEKQFFPLDADMATVSLYLDSDGMKPFLRACGCCDKSIFVLIETSSLSSGELQDQLIDGEPPYARVADLTSAWDRPFMEGARFNAGAVVGATCPEVLAELRVRMPHIFLLIPSYGAQSGKAEDPAIAFNVQDKSGIADSSRGIIATWKQGKHQNSGVEAFADVTRQTAVDMTLDLQRYTRF